MMLEIEQDYIKTAMLISFGQRYIRRFDGVHGKIETLLLGTQEDIATPLWEGPMDSLPI